MHIILILEHFFRSWLDFSFDLRLIDWFLLDMHGFISRNNVFHDRLIITKSYPHIHCKNWTKKKKKRFLSYKTKRICNTNDVYYVKFDTDVCDSLINLEKEFFWYSIVPSNLTWILALLFALKLLIYNSFKTLIRLSFY